MPVFTPARLAQSNVASTTETAVYTATGSAIVQSVVFANVTGADASISLSLVPSGGTAGVTNRLVEQVTIPARETVHMALSAVMAAGDFLSLKQGTASAVTSTISGVTF